MGNMGMADSEWHEKSARTAEERDHTVTPSTPPGDFEIVEEALLNNAPDYNIAEAHNALARLRARVEELEEALREIAEALEKGGLHYFSETRKIARRALAHEEEAK